MKKKIGYINLDSSLTTWLLQHLPESELKDGIRQLNNDEYSSLMIEIDGDEPIRYPSNIIQSGTLTIDQKARRVKQNGIEVSLTPKEFDILLFLAQNRGEIFTKEQIYNAVWEQDYIMDDSNIMAFIRKLRKKIEPNPDAPQYIITIWGIGYKFTDQM